MSNQPLKPLEHTKKESTLEHENLYKIALNKQYLDVKGWKLKVEMVLNMTNKEIQKKNAKMIELVCSKYLSSICFKFYVVNTFLLC